MFHDIGTHLRDGDLLVMNDSRVIPARLRGQNERTGGQFELLLLEENATNDWWIMLRPGKRGTVGARIQLHPRKPGAPAVSLQVLDVNEDGHRRVRFEGVSDIASLLDLYGEIPLPPYIRRDKSGPGPEDEDRYQTVYARTPGSVAAPTAGLHFTPEILSSLQARGVTVAHVTLHTGLGTFAPVKTDTLSGHRMHEERYSLPAATSAAIQQTRANGGRVIAAGTTTVRVLETVAAANNGELPPSNGRTRIFIYPPCKFRAVDGLLTNFHLPCSTLLMLVSAFAAPGSLDGVSRMQGAYRDAITNEYRFFSYGDAMLLI
jgi:S-adenosylmethionine:tRNA ribosyltransferase-isomerase